MKKILFATFLLFNTLLFSQAVAVITVDQDSVCLGQGITLSSSSSIAGSSPIINSIWSLTSPNSDAIIGSTAPGVDFSANIVNPGIYSVSLINQHQNGTSSFSQQVDLLTVFALPIAVLTSQDPLAGCSGVSFIADFENQSIHPLGSFGSGSSNDINWASSNPFEWTFSNGNPSFNTFTQNRSDMLSSVIDSNTTITLQVTDGFGCVSDVYTLGAFVQQPSALFEVPNEVCNNDIFNTTINSFGNFTSYLWTLDGVQLSSTSNSSIPLPPSWYINDSQILSAQHTISLVVSDNLGCGDTAQTQTITILNPIIEPNFTDVKFGFSGWNGAYNCPPVVVNFTNTSTSSLPIDSYSWSFGNNIQNPNEINTQASPQGVQFLFPGTYDINLTIMDTSGCTSTLNVDNFLLIGGPSATASVNQTGNSSFMEYSFNISNLSNVNSVYWNLGNGETITNDSDGFIYTYQTSGTFNPVLHIVDALGCDVAYQLGTIITGINSNEELSEQSKTTIYPNPTTDFLNLSLSTYSRLEILDLQGKIIESKLYSITDNKIDVSQLGSGMYLLKVISSEKQEMMRFQKM